MERCPTCGHEVKSIFDHIDIDCEHDMSPLEISRLLHPEEIKRLEDILTPETLSPTGE